MLRCSREKIWLRILSKSYISRLGGAEQSALRTRVMRALDEAFGAEPRADELIDYPYTTDVFYTTVK